MPNPAVVDQDEYKYHLEGHVIEYQSKLNLEL